MTEPAARVSERPIRVLLLLTQMPQDPASGAARTMRTLAQFLAGAAGAPRFSVRALATTASEAGELPGGAAAYLRGAGFTVSTELLDEGGRQRALRFADGPVACSLLDMPGQPREIDPELRFAFDLLLEEALSWSPDLVFTFGGNPDEVAWRQQARQRGARVIFCLRNMAYLGVEPSYFGPAGAVDAVIVASHYQAARYREALGLEATALPMPIDLEEILAPATSDRVFATFVNPILEKGVVFIVRLFDELAHRRPDLPLLVIESGGGSDALIAVAERAGIDLRRHENIMISPAVAHPREIYAVSRVILMPSVWEEPSGRIAAEAMLNGVPPIVSDRGGLPETCADGGGIVLPIPKSLTTETLEPPSVEEVEAWIAAIERLFDDETAYTEASERVRRAARQFLPETLASKYCAFFAEVFRRART